MPSSKTTLKTWMAYRIKGAKAEPHHGYAETKEKADTLLGCHTEAEGPTSGETA